MPLLLAAGGSASAESASAWTMLVEVLLLLSAALLLGTAAERLKQHAIVGYLIAGALVGPHVFGWVAGRGEVETIAELGVAMLLFSIGLEFSFTRLIGLGRVALLGGALQVTLTAVVAAVVAALFGVGGKSAVVIGLIVSLSSTACVLRLLMDQAAVDSQHGRNAVGILLMQDVAVVPIMLLVTLLAGGGDGGFAGAATELGKAVLIFGGLIAVMFGLFTYVVPRLLNLQQWARNRELPILLALIVALGAAVLAHYLGISPALGAFIAGILLAASPFATQIRADVAPIRTLLVTLFFASIGMLADPGWALAHGWLVLLVAVVILVGKAAIVFGLLRLLKVHKGVALASGLCLAQIGEFSFVVASVARGSVISEQVFKLMVATTILTLLITPALVRFGPRAGRRLERRRDLSDVDLSTTPDPDLEAQGMHGPGQHDLLIVGFGPAGQRVAETLLDPYRDRILVLDMNPRNAVIARNYGLAVQTGDARQVDVLEHAGLAYLHCIVLALPDVDANRHIIHLVRQFNPDVKLIVRSRYHVARWELQMAGAHEVVDEEDTMGVRLAELAADVMDQFTEQAETADR